MPLEANGLVKLLTACGALMSEGVESLSRARSGIQSADESQLRRQMEDAIADVMAACRFHAQAEQLNHSRIAVRAVARLRQLREWHAQPDVHDEGLDQPPAVPFTVDPNGPPTSDADPVKPQSGRSDSFVFQTELTRLEEALVATRPGEMSSSEALDLWKHAQQRFNDVINFALDAGPEGPTFLRLWREGDSRSRTYATPQPSLSGVHAATGSVCRSRLVIGPGRPASAMTGRHPWLPGAHQLANGSLLLRRNRSCARCVAS